MWNEEDGTDICDFYDSGRRDLLATHPAIWLPMFEDVVQPHHIFEIPDDCTDFFYNVEHKIPSFLNPATLRDGIEMMRRPQGQDVGSDDEAESWGSQNSRPATPQNNNLNDEDEYHEEVADGHDLPESMRMFVHPATLQELVDGMKKGFAICGGPVIPKFLWKVPKDARWIALNKSLKCYEMADIVLLLKHSSHVEQSIEIYREEWKKDLDEHPPDFAILAKECITHNKKGEQCLPKRARIILFKWDDSFGPEFEFRCFVANKKLILISQRNGSQAFASMGQDRDGIIQDIHDFFKKYIYDRFPLDFYSFDVMRMLNRVILIDFNTFGLQTDPALSSYKELKHLMSETEQNASRGDGLGLVNPEKYGEPYFRYATESVLTRANPDIQSPHSMDFVTYLMERMAMNP